MKSRINNLINKIKFSFSSTNTTVKFENKLRQMIEKHQHIKIRDLIDHKRFFKLGCDFKDYLYEFSNLFIETKEKVLQETLFSQDDMFL